MKHRIETVIAGLRDVPATGIDRRWIQQAITLINELATENAFLRLQAKREQVAETANSN